MRTIVLFLTLAFALVFPPKPSYSGPSSRMAVVEKPRSAGSFFDLGQGAIRVVAVLPLSGPSTDETIASIVDVFAAVPTSRVRAFVIFSPVTSNDTQLFALQRFGRIADKRFVGFWDPTVAVSDHWRVPAGLSPGEGSAVFLYETGTRFVDVDTIPPFWREGAGALSSAALQDSVVALLARFVQASAVEKANENP